MSKKNQKQTLAIYGCSYADWQCGPEHLQLQGWSKLLEQDYKIYNYARAGSSNFYNYKNFLETHHKYDKVIFSQTFAGRWPYPLIVDGQEIHISRIQQIEDTIAYFKNLNYQDTIFYKKLESLQMYYLHLEDYTTSKMIDDALLSHMKSVRKDVIIIPMTFWSHTHRKMIGKFNYFERRDYQKNPWRFEEKNLLNHFPIEYHPEIYAVVKELINTGQLPCLYIEPKFTLQPFNYYYEFNKLRI